MTNILKTERLKTDILIIGGGTAGCYAAVTVAEHSDAKVLICEKAHIKRSGCLAAGVNALNAYITEGRVPAGLSLIMLKRTLTELSEKIYFLQCPKS